jgi:hypothetical protein
MKSWTKVRGGLRPESQTRMDMHLQETLSRSTGLVADEFMALRALENQRVLFTFRDGQSFIARLLSVTSDFDGSQHLVYDQVEGVSDYEGIACYAAGEELLSCEGVD